MSASRSAYDRCPIPKTHRRLVEAHLLWHQTMQNYDAPESFRANLNSTIEAMRNVTFVLQKEKHAFPQFDEWYTPWQTRLKANSAAKWLQNARTVVVHRGELETHSTAEVRLVTWKDELLATVNVSPETPSELILQHLPLLDLVGRSKALPGDLADAAIAIQRRWCSTELADSELLDALGQAYGVLSDIVLDAHIQLGQCECISSDADHPDFRSIHHRTGTLECMAAGVELRTKRFKLSTRDRIDRMLVPEPKRGDASEAQERYGIDEKSRLSEWEGADPVKLAQKTLYIAKRILRRDKFHQRMMFIRDGKGTWHTMSLSAADRTEKHLAMRMVAQFVESRGCDAIIEVGEMWRLPADKAAGANLNRLDQAKGRSEVLVVTLATRDGLFQTHATPFTRGPLGGIRLGDTEEVDLGLAYYLRPVLEVWRRQGTIILPGGKLLRRVWEPDPLDPCFCGGLKRFGECCKHHIPTGRNSRDVDGELRAAIAQSQFSRAEELSRAALAQYVIWIKQHTAPLMNVAQDLYSKILAIDVFALEALIRSFERCLAANGKAHEFRPALRQLSRIIGLPKITLRLTALASQWLFRARLTEEAVLELDSLGDLDRVDDTLALTTAVDILDLPRERSIELLRRAVGGAVCDEEKWGAQLALANRLFGSGNGSEAVATVDSVADESGRNDEHKSTQVEAALLRWRITHADADFSIALKKMNQSSLSDRRRYAAMLIDEGRFDEAEELLARDLTASDEVAKLLITDARIRRGNRDSARDLFMTITQDHIPESLRTAYAVTSGLVALSCGDEELRRNAIPLVEKELGAPGEMGPYLKNLLVALRDPTGEQLKPDST